MTRSTCIPSVKRMDDDDFICSICHAECGFEWDEEYEQEVGGPAFVSVADDGTEMVVCDDCAAVGDFHPCG